MRLAAAAFLVMAGATPALAQQKPALTPADYARWESIEATALSPDGEWFAYTVTRVDDDGELRYRQAAHDSTVVVQYGSRPAFSPGGRWLAYSTGVAEDERERLQASNEPIRSKVGIADLHTGAVRVVDDIADFAFSGDGRYLWLRGYAGGDGSSKGVDVIVQDLETGVNTTFGNVAEQAWQDSGALLAMVIDAASSAGDGVRLYDAASGVIRTLEVDTAGFRGLVWRDGSADLAFLRVRPDSAWEEPNHTIIAWRGVDARGG
ncbi:MAG: S9 family peptidase, partial [Gemmatimonadota bacterium]